MKLKCYSAYMERLRNYARANGLSIEYGDEDAFLPSRNKIKLEEDTSQSFRVAVFVHELGHFIDFITISGKQSHDMERAYKLFYADQHRSKSGRIVVEAEKRAWKFGRSIAKRLKIRLGKWFNEVEKDCLQSYKDDL